MVKVTGRSTRTLSASLTLLFVICAGSPAHTDGAVSELEAAASAVAKAHASGDAALLSKLASRAEPDLFLVAEVLCARAGPAAAALAKVARGPDERLLATYVRERLKTPPSAEDVNTLLAAHAEHVRKDWSALQRRTVGDVDTVLDAAIGRWRADALYVTAKGTEASGAYLAAARRARRIGWFYESVRCYIGADRAFDRVFDYRDLLTATRERVAVQRERAFPKGVAEALVREGTVLTMLGRYALAFERLEEAQVAFEKLDERDQVARVLHVLASIHRRMGEHGRALVVAERGLDMARSPARRARLLTALGITRWAIGQNDEALAAYGQALAIVHELEDPEWAAKLKLNIGIARSSSGDFDGAQRAYEEALATFQKLKASAQAATALLNLADLANRRGRHTTALDLCERAKEPAKEAEDPLLIALAAQNLAESLLGLERFDAAGKAFEGHIAQAEALGARKHLLEGHLGLAQCRLAEGNSRGALDAAMIGIAQVGAMVGGLAEGQEAEARSQHARLFEVAVAAAADLGDATAFTEVVETGRAMALLESLEGREKLRKISIPEKYRKEEAEARAALVEARTIYQSAFNARVLAQVRERRTELKAATKRLEDVIERIRRETKTRAALVYPTADGLATLQGYLKAGEALVLYALTEKDYVALVAEPNAARIVRLAGREDVDAACEAVVAATTDESTEAKKELDGLRRLVVDPLKLHARVTRLLVSLTGDLYLAPLSVLVANREVVHVPSGTTYGLLLSSAGRPGESVIALGDIDYSSYARLGGLPASAAEARAVGDKVLLRDEATEGAVRTVIPARRRWRAVHFACHGLLDLERPMQSALALTKQAPDDGLLTVIEIFTATVPADLVTLSACESGRGRIYSAEGLIGLTRAFMYAGAPRIICSLWKVDDDATRAVMMKFYELWNPKKGKGLSAAAALKKAQDHVRAQPKWKHPYFWAAWVLWGLPD